MAFLDKTGLQTLTNRLVQGDAIKVASHRGRTIENVIDNITRECTNIPTPLEYKIENRVTDFRVGQGRDVDASGDVEKGYTEVELQGKTWQNLAENKFNKVDMDKNNHTGHFNLLPNVISSKTYTIIIEVSNLNLDGQSFISFNLRGNKVDGTYSQIKDDIRIKSNVTVTSFISKESFITGLLAISGSMNSNNPSFTLKRVTILEGDYTQTSVEELPNYFEGIQSSFEDGVVDIDVLDVDNINKKKISFNIDEPLRSLPNGVCDSIDKNGILTRRVGRVVLDGSESWQKEVSRYWVSLNSIDTPMAKGYGTYVYSNNFIQVFTHDIDVGKCRWGSEQNFMINIDNGAGGVVFAKQWLQSNPTTVYYELATPVITPIEPIKFETQPLGSITINSEISPTSFHTVQLNRAAQIERGITEIAELKNRVEILETMYDSHFLETAHKLELLGMDYELESEVI